MIVSCQLVEKYLAIRTGRSAIILLVPYAGCVLNHAPQPLLFPLLVQRVLHLLAGMKMRSPFVNAVENPHLRRGEVTRGILRAWTSGSKKPQARVVEAILCTSALPLDKRRVSHGCRNQFILHLRRFHSRNIPATDPQQR